MTSKLKEVARAICRAGGEDPDECYGPHSTAEGRPFWVDRIDEARAALEAMKNPTIEMKRALLIHRGYDPDAKEETLDRLGQIDIATMHVFISAYHAMIDGALGEKP